MNGKEGEDGQPPHDIGYDHRHLAVEPVYKDPRDQAEEELGQGDRHDHSAQGQGRTRQLVDHHQDGDDGEAIPHLGDQLPQP